MDWLLDTLGAAVATAFGAGILQFFIDWILRKRERTKRRRRIVLLVVQSAEIVFDNIWEGHIVNAWSRPETREHLNGDENYWALAQEALGLFEADEQVVADWLAFEFEFGRNGMLYFLFDQDVPLSEEAAQKKLEGLMWDGPEQGEIREYGPPRAGMLAEWAELRTPGPIRSSSHACGDASRQHLIELNSFHMRFRQSPVHNYAPKSSFFRRKWSDRERMKYCQKLEKKSRVRWQRDNGISRRVARSASPC